MRQIAEIHLDSKALHLVLGQGELRELPDSDPEDCSDDQYELYLVESFHTPRQRLLKDWAFPDRESAIRFCQEEYSVAPNCWTNEPKYSLRMGVEYRLSCSGVPQPKLMSPPQGKLMFHTSLAETGENVNPNGYSYDLQIFGDRAGLRALAARLLITAESEAFDDEFHWHLDFHSSGNTSVTIRSPIYLRRLE